MYTYTKNMAKSTVRLNTHTQTHAYKPTHIQTPTRTHTCTQKAITRTYIITF